MAKNQSHTKNDCAFHLDYPFIKRIDFITTSAEVIAQLPQPEAFGWVVHATGASA